MLVEYLRAHHGNGPADWYERYWSGARGRYCLVHSRYAGCNNNMGVEVGWREIKKICDALAKLGAFIGALCHFISSALGSESMARLKRDSGDRNAFIRIPMPLKFMWDQVQTMHRLTLSCCVIIESSRQNAQALFVDLMAEVLECGADLTPLHMKISLSNPASRFRRRTSERPFPTGRSASQSAVWQAGRGFAASRRRRTTRRRSIPRQRS